VGANAGTVTGSGGDESVDSSDSETLRGSRAGRGGRRGGKGGASGKGGGPATGGASGGNTASGGTSNTGGSTSGGKSGSGGAATGGSSTGGQTTLNTGNATSPIGTNLEALTDYSSQYPFVDAFKTSMAWVSTGNSWNDGIPISLDQQGWVRSLQPGQVVTTLLFTDQPSYPAGQYIVKYDGSGTLNYSAGAQKASSTAGRDVVNVDPTRGAFRLDIQATDPANPLRNIRVIMPGGVCANDSFAYCDSANACSAGAACNPFEQVADQQEFHPQFLASLKNYRSVRFMDWQLTNEPNQVNFSDRPKVEDARWTLKGVPAEIMIDLANRLGADPWFCMNHRATDDYVRGFAGLVQTRLAPGLKVYVEHSNEVWNGIFPQANYAREQGLALNLSTNPFEAQMRYHSRRSVQIFRLFRQSIATPSRVVAVMASQAANSWSSTTSLSFENAAQETNALAIAPYFGGSFGDGSLPVPANVDALIQQLSTVALNETTQWVSEQSAAARQFNVALISYEGGQHLVGVAGRENDTNLSSLFDQANRDPRMKQVYLDYLARWKANGGQLFTHFTHTGRFTKWGRWGTLESLTQTRAQAPKYDALQTFIGQNPKWW
jgi:hypothetical protein